jgi:hypothetical protein
MNSQFLELFGNYLIQAARWQKLIEQTSPGVTPVITDVAEFGRLFKQVCILNKPAELASAEYSRMWQQTIENFQSAFCLNARFWDWVPQADYQILQKKYEALEKSIHRQDQTISQLRSLLEEKGLGQIELIQRYQSLIRDQSDEFQMFMKNFSDAVLKTEDRRPKAKDF